MFVRTLKKEAYFFAVRELHFYLITVLYGSAYLRNNKLFAKSSSKNVPLKNYIQLIKNTVGFGCLKHS